MNTRFFLNCFASQHRPIVWLVLVWCVFSWGVPISEAADGARRIAWSEPVINHQDDEDSQDFAGEKDAPETQSSRENGSSEGDGASVVESRIGSGGEGELRNRLIAAAIIGGVVLTMLGIVFGYLRLDHATRGFYSGRLQSIAAATAIVVLLIGYLLWVQLIV